MEAKSKEVEVFDGEKFVIKIFGYDGNGSPVEEVVSVEHTGSSRPKTVWEHIQDRVVENFCIDASDLTTI